ncbi:hypothetical protein MRB53_003029 [Persea americana]|uniref:Uncharacterized protein n=1 Tax=Persea americana TaxID=3435 RepID=A0ACC2MW56_PERAE|nr:hypothetical protein MRB53_003029 [Persea americana]
MEGRRRDDGMAIRKGPWMAEEDEILMDYVNKYGPRDWSAIRSKEEERVVIDLQAQFGNKWARIATYLPGRTDNDVKNFWSTRQKRLARILQTSSPPKSNKNHSKLPVFHCESQALEDSALCSMPFQEESSNGQCGEPMYSLGNSDIIKMVPLPDLINPNFLNLETNLQAPDEFIHLDKKPCLDPSLQFPPTHFPQQPLDIPPLSWSHDLTTGFIDASFLDIYRDASEKDLQFPFELPFTQLDVNQHCTKRQDNDLTTPDSFFHDFPADMFDHLEPLPNSSE